MISLMLALLLQAPIPGQVSKPDASGAYTVTLNIPGQPVGVKAGETWQQSWTWRLPGNTLVRRVRSFFGVDRGDAFEGHLLVLAADYSLHLRGPHKEVMASYDAWASEGASYVTPAGGEDCNVYALCRPTAGKAINCQVGVILELQPKVGP